MTMQNKFSRRQSLLGSGAFLIWAGMAEPVWALSKSEAKKLINKAVEDINKVLASDQTADKRTYRFEQIFKTYADVPFIAKYGLGVDGRSASKAQVKAFTTSFRGYIARKYGKQFKDVFTGEIEVKGTRKIKSYYEVKAAVLMAGKAPVELAFLVSDRSGQPLFFNLFVEGVNMLLIERAEIGAMLDKRGGNMDKMIKDLGSAG
jgi:phospholipid transport system substrate-binding protein